MAFQVPCGCGRTVSATAGDAGATLRCPCGRDVAVPDLHALRQLEPVAATAPAPALGPRAELRRRGTTFAIGGLVLFAASLLGARALRGTAFVQSGAAFFVYILCFMLMWLGTLAGASCWAAAKGYPRRTAVLLAILGPSGWILALLLPNRGGDR